MRKLFKLLIIGLFTLASTVIHAQAIAIQLKIKKGEVYSTEMLMTNAMKQEVMGQKIEMMQHIVMITDVKVVDKLTNGNYLMEQSYKKMRIEMVINGKNMTMDADSIENNPQAAGLKKIKTAVITFEVSPTGLVSNLKGFEEMVTSLNDNPQTAQILKGITNDDMVVNYYSYIPKTKIKKGDSYVAKVKMEQMMGMAVDTKYTLMGFDKKSIDLSLNTDISFSPDKPLDQNGISMKIAGNGKQSGTFVVDRKSGMPASSNMVQDMDMSMRFNNPQTNEEMAIPVKVHSTVKMTVTKN